MYLSCKDYLPDAKAAALPSIWSQPHCLLTVLTRDLEGLEEGEGRSAAQEEHVDYICAAVLPLMTALLAWGHPPHDAFHNFEGFVAALGAFLRRMGPQLNRQQIRSAKALISALMRVRHPPSKDALAQVPPLHGNEGWPGQERDGGCHRPIFGGAGVMEVRRFPQFSATAFCVPPLPVRWCPGVPRGLLKSKK